MYWPGQFLDFFLVGPSVCTRTHIAFATASSIFVSFVCSHVCVCWHGVLNLQRADRRSLFRNNPPRLIGGNVKASRGHSSLWQAAQKCRISEKKRARHLLWGIVCMKSCTFHFCLFSCSQTLSPFFDECLQTPNEPFPSCPTSPLRAQKTVFDYHGATVLSPTPS